MRDSVNSLGNLGGFVGPSIVGMAKELTGTFESGRYVLGGMGFAAALVALLFVRGRTRQVASMAHA